ncbi:MAG: helix-turn-helix domain-containing protein, partial [Pseudomonadota bacterium]
RELKNAVERSVYRWDLEEPIGEIVLDPFESPYRPTPLRQRQASSQPSPDLRSHSDPRHATVNADETNPTTATEHSAAEADVVPFPPLTPTPERAIPEDFKAAVQAQEIAWLIAALTEANFNQRKAAERLSLTYHQLRGYIKKYQLLDRSDDTG